MTRARSRIPRPSAAAGWLPVALLLLGAGWGSQQFTPMLLVYHHALHLSTGTLEALFGFYAVGLIPGLLVAGPLSDTRGRRGVLAPAAGLSLLGTLAVLLAGHSVALLYAGRFLTGVSTGAVFSAGTAWLRELSQPPFGDAREEVTARRTAVAMTLGFGLGALSAGVLAQWAPAPRVVPYAPHVLLMIAVLVWIRRAPETIRAEARSQAAVSLRRSLRLVSAPRFRWAIAPLAPWVFVGPAIAFALLPSVVGTQRDTDGVALTAAVTTLCALSGVLIQPLARRLAGSAGGTRASAGGLLILTGGMGLAALTAEAHATWLLIPTELVFGAGYGLCLVAGLVEVQRLADQHALAGLTAIFYSLAYLGFAAPYLLALAAPLAGYPALLGIAAILSLLTAGLVSGQNVRGPRRTIADLRLS